MVFYKGKDKIHNKKIRKEILHSKNFCEEKINGVKV
jgi:hypothetical protein